MNKFSTVSGYSLRDLDLKAALGRMQLATVRHWPDMLISVGLILLGTVFALALAQQLDPAILSIYAGDTWFQADLPRTAANMLHVDSQHFRTNVHPIVSLITIPLTHAIGLLWAGTDAQLATRLVAIAGGLWAAGLYTLSRCLGAARWRGLIFTALGVSSGSFIFWFSVPETYGLGSLTILIVLILGARLPAKQYSDSTYIAASAASLSFTITNWMAGIALSLMSGSWRRAIRITLITLVLVAVLAVVQKLLIPSSTLFFLPSRGELRFVNHAFGGGVVQKLTALLLHSFAAPEPSVRAVVNPYWSILSMQFSPAGSGSQFGIAALCLWIGLLVMGLWGAWLNRRRPFVMVLGLILAGQIGLHLLYGDESFLYTLHLMPLFVALAMLAMFTPFGRFVPWIALGAAGLGLANNMQVHSAAAAHVDSFLNQRQIMAKAEREHPRAIWPRGKSHVVLSVPGSGLADKAYHEPGGAYSPAPGSFGASIWVADASGKIVAASETLPLAEIRQRFVPRTGKATPGLKTETPYFTAVWSKDDGHSSLTLTPGPASKGLHLWLILRSVGPAGGPLYQAKTEANGFLLNGKWRVEATRPFAQTRLADEKTGGVRLSGNSAAINENNGNSRSGWMYVAALLDDSQPNKITISQTAATPASGLAAAFGAGATLPAAQAGAALTTTDAAWAPQVADVRFAASALAQQAHLLMGLVGRQTRPGDPVNYTLQWARDASYIIVALARAGQLKTARQLAAEITTQDFAGGFGPEIDAPALEIWTLVELAQMLDDPDFDARLWPHVQRKARWITSCLAATEPINVDGNIWSEVNRSHITKPFRLCEPSRRGLIVGLMDKHYPALYLNAVAYSGLRHAAKLAERLGHKVSAAAYNSQADALENAWHAEFMKSRLQKSREAIDYVPEMVRTAMQESALRRNLKIASNWVEDNSNERTLAAAQWPTWMLGDSATLKKAYIDELDQRWQASRDAVGGYLQRPQWTYFEFAQAHQWLLLGQPAKAWETLDWFFRHQSSVGLYSWWEGAGEENTSHLWPMFRGWIKPESVTPHYWTAAEALMLQLDMLAYVDESRPQRPLVIGAGVPAAWLSQPIDSGLIHTAHGNVRWQWAHGTVSVETSAAQVPIELGPVFRGAHVSRTVLPPAEIAERHEVIE